MCNHEDDMMLMIIAKMSWLVSFLILSHKLENDPMTTKWTVLLQAQAACQATAAAEATAQLAALAQQQKEVNKAVQSQQQQVKAAQQSLADLQTQHQHVGSELNALLGKVPELSDMLHR